MNASTPSVLEHEHVKTEYAFKSGNVGEQARRLADQFARHSDRSSPQILIDLTHVEYVGSEDLGAIVGLHKKVRGVGGQLTLVNVRPKVSEVISITRLDTLLNIHRIS